MQYFDYKKAARKAGIAPNDLKKLCRLIRKEFPHEDMMYELHVLRACMAIQAGDIRLEDILRDSTAVSNP